MKNSLRIGIIGTRGIPNRYGGFEAFAEQVSVRLAAKGHHVSVYCSHSQAYREKMMEGVHLAFVRNPENLAGTAGQFLYDLGCNLHARKQQYDVILHLGYTSDSVWTWLWCGRARHITNMDGMEWMRSKYPAPVQAFLKKAEKLAAAGSDLLIADSRAIKVYLESKYPTPVRYIAYGAIIPASFDAAVPGKFNVESGRYDLIIARMEPENNLEMAVKAKVSEGSAIPLLIFSNNTDYGNSLKRKYLQEPTVQFHAANYNPEVLNSLRHHARFYIHGHSAGGTNPSLLEAMACGCHILAHDNPYNRDVLAENSGYFASEAQLAALLKSVPNPDTERSGLENNLAAIRDRYEWNKITNEYESAFYQVLEH